MADPTSDPRDHTAVEIDPEYTRPLPSGREAGERETYDHAAVERTLETNRRMIVEADEEIARLREARCNSEEIIRRARASLARIRESNEAGLSGERGRGAERGGLNLTPEQVTVLRRALARDESTSLDDLAEIDGRLVDFLAAGGGAEGGDDG